MPESFAKLQEKYAELIIRVGLNLQPGQRLLIGAPVFSTGTPIEAAPFIRKVAAQAYQAGARLVDVLWGDEEMRLIRLQNAPRDSFSEYPTWRSEATAEILSSNDAYLSVYAGNPDIFNNEDPDLIATLQKAASQQSRRTFELIGQNATNWTVISVPISGWAAKVYPDYSPEKQLAQLWADVFKMCRVETDNDPVARWQEHLQELVSRRSYLNEKSYVSLRFTGPGTDLQVGLPQGHIWQSGRVSTQDGRPFTANVPTEEIFTLPHRAQTEGFVTATRPLSYGGSLMEGFTISFTQGQVSKVTARQGEESIKRLIATDAGAVRLGEVALVPHSSPISQSGRLFYNILFDENAANHIALGQAYKFTMDGGPALSDDAFMAAGGNLSLIHVDFMIGSGEMDVDGLTADGDIEPVMRRGEWAFDV